MSPDLHKSRKILQQETQAKPNANTTGHGQPQKARCSWHQTKKATLNSKPIVKNNNGNIKLLSSCSKSCDFGIADKKSTGKQITSLSNTAEWCITMNDRTEFRWFLNPNGGAFSKKAITFQDYDSHVIYSTTSERRLIDDTGWANSRSTRVKIVVCSDRACQANPSRTLNEKFQVENKATDGAIPCTNSRTWNAVRTFYKSSFPFAGNNCQLMTLP